MIFIGIAPLTVAPSLARAPRAVIRAASPIFMADAAGVASWYDQGVRLRTSPPPDYVPQGYAAAAAAAAEAERRGLLPQQQARR